MVKKYLRCGERHAAFVPAQSSRTSPRFGVGAIPAGHLSEIMHIQRSFLWQTRGLSTEPSHACLSVRTKMLTTNQIRRLIAAGETKKFYEDYSWKKLAHAVIKEQNNECQLCKKRGRATPAVLVHHVLELKEHPEFAYSRWQDEAHTKRQLIALCQQCHEEQHPNRFGQNRAEHYTNEEKW